MSEFSIFIAGGIVGIVCLALLILAHNIGAQPCEIQWHDFHLETPSKYTLYDESGNPYILVLLHYDNNAITIAPYYPDVPHVKCKGFPDVLHFAYLAELQQTIPTHIEPPYNDYCNVL